MSENVIDLTPYCLAAKQRGLLSHSDYLELAAAVNKIAACKYKHTQEIWDGIIEHEWEMRTNDPWYGVTLDVQYHGLNFRKDFPLLIAYGVPSDWIEELRIFQPKWVMVNAPEGSEFAFMPEKFEEIFGFPFPTEAMGFNPLDLLGDGSCFNLERFVLNTT